MVMDFFWLLISALLVFCMQAGFLCLESGKIRSKNSINVAAKNITDFIIASIIFWAFGFALMFGDSVFGIVGSNQFFVGEDQSAYQISFFIFQMMFCGTSATLLSGAVAERMSFFGYICIAAILTAVIYPIIGHWAWASSYHNGNVGWLEQLGFVDFAGSTVVHSVGGYVALAAIVIIGPRIGRFDTTKLLITGSNVPMSVLGVLLIWLGWYGFNGGSTLQLTEQVPKILLNTTLAASWGGVAASILHYWHKRFVDIGFLLNGVIAGLVAVTAGCHAVSPFAAMLIGIVAGIILYTGTLWIESLKIDDALGVVPAHLFAGVWGTLAVALFADLSLLGTGLNRLHQFNIQLLGVVSVGGYCLVISYFLIRVINRFIPLRVSEENELKGMNVSEHHASTELIDLLNSMNNQQQKGSFSDPVPVEPFTEVGLIAEQYNKVIGRVNSEIVKRDNAISHFNSSEKRKSAILHSSMDSILIIDLMGCIIEFNPAAERTFGYARKQVEGHNFIDLFILPEDQKKIRESLIYRFSSTVGLMRDRRNGITLLRNSGHQFSAEVTVTSANIGSTESNEFTLHIRDITRQLKLQDKLRELAYSDPLTGLYNRTYLMNSLTNILSIINTTDENIMLFFMDLDRFKKINDTLGHKMGDELLCEVSQRLIKVTRDSDIIARWGGDEFIILFRGAFSIEMAHSKANEVLAIMREPLTLAGREINIPTSIGIAFAKTDQENAEKLIQHADLAMYTAKQLGRDNYQLFEAEMAKVAARNFNYEQEMRHGLSVEDQFSLHYQPKVTSSKELVGLEALIRWNHPVEGNISPVEFIPLAEESDLIVDIGEWVIRHAISQLTKWQASGFKLVPVSINISTRHLISGRLIEYLETVIAQYSLDPTFLEIEITEGVLLTDTERCIEVMSELKKLNIKISIDDFGTGYSSLSYLKRLPIDVLKIDRTFVNECATLIEDAQICTTIINLATNLQLSTVAEGVETIAQVEFLIEHGCDVFQGFYFYRPMPATEIAALLKYSSSNT
jgi:Amt family ammonium transporter